MKYLTRLVAIVAALLLTAYLGWRLVRFLEVDSCLDSGGRYDYEAGACVTTVSSLPSSRLRFDPETPAVTRG